MGALSTYTTDAPGCSPGATSCTLPTPGSPEPRSRNWVIPASATRYRTARPRKARFSRTAVRKEGATASACLATSRSAAKLSLPPRKKSYTRAGCGLDVSICGGTSPLTTFGIILRQCTENRRHSVAEGMSLGAEHGGRAGAGSGPGRDRGDGNGQSDHRGGEGCHPAGRNDRHGHDAKLAGER